MHVCMHACMYVCIYVLKKYIYIHIYIYIYIYIYLSIYLSIYLYIYIYGVNPLPDSNRLCSPLGEGRGRRPESRGNRGNTLGAGGEKAGRNTGGGTRLARPHRRWGKASDGVRYAGARSSVGCRF